jgi:penicillin-binding protein 1B
VAAAVRNARADSYIQGGSTITQQLVKNFFLTPERTIRRKLQEALLAFVLERRAEKKDILELYLNEVYLGQVGSFSIHGVGEAARMYFHKDVGNLTLAEASLTRRAP